jgi:outer membrane receptor protein involved in Fe transport
LTDAGADVARNADKKALTETVNGKPVKYSNTSQHWLFYGKAKISDFTIGYQVWKYEQGNINYFNDNNEAGSANNSIWAPRESFAYAKYDKQLTDNLSVMNLAQYRITEIADNSTAVYLTNYANRGLNAGSLLANRPASWTTEYYYQISRQFRNETKFNYTPTKDLDILTGVEVRNSSVQGDYRKSAGTDVIEKGKSAGDAYLGGNDFTIYDLGIYAQARYKYQELVQLVLGGRYDKNRIRKTGGYGSQFNPRIALIGTPGNAIIKVIYARAFQNASNWTKFATNPSRQLANPTLKPEQVQNVDVSAGYKVSKDIYVDAVAYYSSYKGVVGTAIVPFGSGTTQQNQAIGALKIWGIQSNLTWKHKNLNAYLNYTFSDPRNGIVKDGVLTGDYLRIGDIAKHHINAGANYLFKEHWNFNLRANWIDKRPVGAGTTVSGNPGNFPSVLILNGAVSYQGLLQGLDVQVICNNITNLQYSDPGVRSADGALYGYRVPQRERNIMLRLTYDLH